MKKPSNKDNHKLGKISKRYQGKNKYARLISDIFVPPVSSFLIFIFLALFLEVEAEMQLLVISGAFIAGVVMPTVFFIYWRKKGKISNFDVTEKDERTLPYLVGMFFSFTGLLFLIYLDAHEYSKILWICYITNTAMVILINRFWKISAHSAGLATAIGALTYVTGWVGLVFVLVLILVGWSRLQLKVHTFNQVFYGGVFGFTFTYLLFYLLAGLLF